MRTKCPKCKDNGIYFDDEPHFERNVCIYCGFSHSTGGYFQSMEYQLTEQNGRFGIGLEFFEYENSLKGKDESYHDKHATAMYQLNKALKRNKGSLVRAEKDMRMAKKIQYIIDGQLPSNMPFESY